MPFAGAIPPLDPPAPPRSRRHKLRLNLARKLQHLADEPLPAASRRAEILLTSCSEPGCSANILRQHRSVKLDSTQRIADFVRHPRRHLAQRGQPLAALQLAVLFGQFVPQRLNRLLKLRVRLLQLFRQIAVDADDAAQFLDPCRVGGVESAMRPCLLPLSIQPGSVLPIGGRGVGSVEFPRRGRLVDPAAEVEFPLLQHHACRPGRRWRSPPATGGFRHSDSLPSRCVRRQACRDIPSSSASPAR